LAGDHTAWGYIIPQIAEFTRVVAYDRAGVGFSDPRPAGTRLTSQFLADELEALLQGAGIEGSLVLVGHSFGGHYQRLFATYYLQRTAGLVLVDCSHEDMWHRFGDRNHRMQSSTILSMRLFAGLASLGFQRLIFPVLVRRLAGWSLEARQQLLRSLSDDQHWRGVAAEAQLSGEVEAAVRLSRRSLGNIPMIIVAAVEDKGKPGSLRRQAWQEMQAEHAALATHASLWLPPKVTHLGLGFYPTEARYTVEAIRSVVQQAAAGKPARLPMPVLK
jgi:pimeloyl-ACP methyl ester carboxylesterase